MRTMMTVMLVAVTLGTGSSALGKSAATKRKNFGYLVLGTIVSANKNNSVALVKHRASGKTTAVRVGQKISKNLLLNAVSKKVVQVRHKGKTYLIRVGSAEEFSPASNKRSIAQQEGLQRKNDNVTVSEAYKDHLLKNELNKILMQAAAVPAIEDGRVRGFTLWEIEKGSIYEKLGFQNGDTVTNINGNELVDAGQAVKVLVSLKSTKNLALKYTRNGVEQQMKVRVQ